MRTEIIEAASIRDFYDFIKLPYRLYKKDKNWVPPLIREQKEWIVNKKTPLFKNNPHAFFLARQGSLVAARVAVVEDLKLRKEKERNIAYFTLIESVEDFSIFQSVMKSAEEWALARGLEAIQGPVSPTKGDDFRGLFVWGFGSRPVLMNSYNPPYYRDFFDKAGYKKHMDLFAYYYDLKSMTIGERTDRVKDAMKKYGFRVDRLDLKNIEGEVRDIKKILDKAVPEEWPDFVTPSYEDVLAVANRFKRYADPDLILIARDSSSRPIGFAIALPDYNYVLHRMKGRMNIMGILRYLYYRRKISGARMFVMFVVPEFRRKGVSTAIYVTGVENALRKGYVYTEGSTIGEENLPMRRDAEKAGGKHYRTYRVYRKELSPDTQYSVS